MSFSSFNSVISSPPATLRTSSPLAELSYSESEPEQYLAEEYAQERELISPTLSTPNVTAPPVTRKNENRLLRHLGFEDVQSLLMES